MSFYKMMMVSVFLLSSQMIHASDFAQMSPREKFESVSELQDLLNRKDADLGLAYRLAATLRTKAGEYLERPEDPNRYRRLLAAYEDYSKKISRWGLNPVTGSLDVEDLERIRRDVDFQAREIRERRDSYRKVRRGTGTLYLVLRDHQNASPEELHQAMDLIYHRHNNQDDAREISEFHSKIWTTSSGKPLRFSDISSWLQGRIDQARRAQLRRLQEEYSSPPSSQPKGKKRSPAVVAKATPVHPKKNKGSTGASLAIALTPIAPSSGVSFANPRPVPSPGPAPKAPEKKEVLAEEVLSGFQISKAIDATVENREGLLWLRLRVQGLEENGKTSVGFGTSALLDQHSGKSLEDQVRDRVLRLLSQRYGDSEEIKESVMDSKIILYLKGIDLGPGVIAQAKVEEDRFEKVVYPVQKSAGQQSVVAKQAQTERVQPVSSGEAVSAVSEPPETAQRRSSSLRATTEL